MPKRSYDTSTGSTGDLKTPPAKVQKTERSHEENQERAYVAASRRTDRSLEARLQSARMASNIHRKRTGRRLRVTEEIVLNEDMYEEMEDEIPRCYQYYVTHHETDSPDTSYQVRTLIASRQAQAAEAKYNEVNKKFLEAFPQMVSLQQTPSSYIYSYPDSPPITHVPESAVSSGSNGNYSLSTQSQDSITDRSILEPSPTPMPDLSSSPTTTSPNATEPTNSPCQVPRSAFLDVQFDPQQTQQSGRNFTYKLPYHIGTVPDAIISDSMAVPIVGGDTALDIPTLEGCGRDSPSLCHPNSDESGGEASSKTSKEPLQISVPFGASVHQTEQLMTPPEGFLPEYVDGFGDGWDPFETFVNFDTEQ
ncbi:hypothetical protein F4859DRAFT_348186 [Xylaria cf. heliscus]|nr:hypothetical protein F4859DRAFT_348186 [Xylaria cf. heliscus]